VPAPCAATEQRKLAFFTGRDQSPTLTGFWAAQVGTPYFDAHGGFCSGNLAAGGIYTTRVVLGIRRAGLEHAKY